MLNQLSFEPIIKCPCNNTQTIENKRIIQCNGCCTYQHTRCMKRANRMRIYLCPECQIAKSNPFEKTISNILPPTLIQRNTNNDKLSFEFNAQISTTQSVVMLRCLKLTKQGFNMIWPEHCIVSINNYAIASFNGLYSSKDDDNSKQPIIFYQEANWNTRLKQTTNVNMTEILSRTQTNTLSLYISWDKWVDQSDYVISIDEIQILTSITKEVIPSVITITDEAYLRQLMHMTDTLPMSEVISLNDVYTDNNRISIPVRGINCLHLSTFDLIPFMLFANKTRRFNCPICNQGACLFYIDAKMKNIIDTMTGHDKVLLDFDYIGSNTDKQPQNKKVDSIAKERKHNNDYILTMELQTINANASTFYEEN